MMKRTKFKALSQNAVKGEVYPFPESHTGQFCSVPHDGIVVEVEVQNGEPADSQIVRNFIAEFEQARKKQSV